MDERDLKALRNLMLMYIFPLPRDGDIKAMEFELEEKGLLNETYKCFDACYEYAKVLVDEKLKKIKEEG